MKPTTRIALVATGSLLAGVWMILHIAELQTRGATRHAAEDAALWLVVASRLGLVLVGGLIVRHRPAHRLGAMFLGAGVLYLAVAAAGAYEQHGVRPLQVGVGQLGTFLNLPAVWLTFVAVPLAFPGGRIRGTSAVLAIAAVAPLLVASTQTAPLNSLRPDWMDLFELQLVLGDAAHGPTIPVVAVYLLVAAAGLVPAIRFLRGLRSPGVGLFAVASGMLALVVGGEAVIRLGGFGSRLLFVGGSRVGAVGEINSLVVGLSHFALVAACAWGIFRHRLFEIDVAVRRTVAFGATSAFLAFAYAASSLVAGDVAGRGSWTVGAAVTGIAAVGLEPLRLHAERATSRVIFGRREPPEVVLQLFAHEVGSGDGDEQLRKVVELIGRARRADDVQLRLLTGDAPFVSWSSGDRGPRGASYQEEIRHRGEVLGALELRRRVGDRITADDVAVVDLVAAGAGPALHNIATVEALREQRRSTAVTLEALRASEERLLRADDETRSRFEHELDVRVRPRLRHASDCLVASDFAGALAQAEQGLREVRATSHGLAPAALRDQGVTEALVDHAASAGIEVEAVVEPERAAPRRGVVGIHEAALFEVGAEVMRHAGTNSRLSIDGSRVPSGLGLVADRSVIASCVEHVRDLIDALDGHVAVHDVSGDRVELRVALPPER